MVKGMIMDSTEAKTTLDDIVMQLRDWAERAGSDMDFADWATLIEEIKDGMDGHADSLDEVGTWIEDDAHRESAESIADDLEGSHAPVVDEDDTFDAGLAAAVEFLREQY